MFLNKEQKHDNVCVCTQSIVLSHFYEQQGHSQGEEPGQQHPEESSITGLLFLKLQHISHNA